MPMPLAPQPATRPTTPRRERVQPLDAQRGESGAMVLGVAAVDPASGEGTSDRAVAIDVVVDGVAPAAAAEQPTPAGAATSAPPRRGRQLRAEIAARLAAPVEGGVSGAVAGILEQVARQFATRAPLGG